MKHIFFASCALVLAACTTQAQAPATPESRIEPNLRHLPDYDTMPPLGKRGDSSQGWKIHDFNRPRPKRVRVAESPSQPAPADAHVLLDAKTASLKGNWRNQNWKVKDGVMSVGDGWLVKDGKVTSTGVGDQATELLLGDCQVHLEWRALDKNHRDMCNSGVIFMDNRYEVQIIDSDPDYNLVPPDAIAGALYGWMPPGVNSIQPAGKWNTYDIVFHRPHFDDKGACTQKARVTLLFNGLLAQDNVELPGPTSWLWRKPYTKHADKLPLVIQNHGGGVEFRNIWVRELE